MTVQCESAALPPRERPEVRRPCLAPFMLAENIPAGGSGGHSQTGLRGLA